LLVEDEERESATTGFSFIQGFAYG
jgi:hypothetical protein